MDMLVVAVLLGLSWSLILTAKIARLLDMSYKMSLWLGVLFCVAAGAPLVPVIIPYVRNYPEGLFWVSFSFLLCAVFELYDAFESKEEVMPPCVPVERPGQGRVVRTAKRVASFLLFGFVLYSATRGSLPSLGQMSAGDTLACVLFTMAILIWVFHSLSQKIEICGNGLLDQDRPRPKFQPWEVYESFSWTEETKDGVQLRLQTKSAGQGTSALMVRPEDREAVQQILEANFPDQFSSAHDGLTPRILPRCVRVRRTRLRRLARHMVGVLCWPAVVLLLVYLWTRSVSLEMFSGVGFLSIMITMGANFLPSEEIEICRNGLLLGDRLRSWEQYECFFWKGETKDGVELRLRSKTSDWRSMTRLVVAPEDREAAQQLLEVSLRDRSTDSAEYAWWRLF